MGVCNTEGRWDSSKYVEGMGTLGMTVRDDDDDAGADGAADGREGGGGRAPLLMLALPGGPAGGGGRRGGGGGCIVDGRWKMKMEAEAEVNGWRLAFVCLF